jgi:hypothetical protein
VKKFNAAHPVPCVYWRNGAYHLVKKNKWERIGETLEEALAEHGRRTTKPDQDKLLSEFQAAYEHQHQGEGGRGAWRNSARDQRTLPTELEVANQSQPQRGGSRSMFLSPQDLEKLTNSKRRDAQARELEHMGIPYTARRDGSLVVLADVIRLMLGGTMRKPEPPEPEVMP